MSWSEHLGLALIVLIFIDVMALLWVLWRAIRAIRAACRRQWRKALKLSIPSVFALVFLAIISTVGYESRRSTWARAQCESNLSDMRLREVFNDSSGWGVRFSWGAGDAESPQMSETPRLCEGAGEPTPYPCKATIDEGSATFSESEDEGKHGWRLSISGGASGWGAADVSLTTHCPHPHRDHWWGLGLGEGPGRAVRTPGSGVEWMTEEQFQAERAKIDQAKEQNR